MGEIIFHIFMIISAVMYYMESFKINTNRVTDTIGPAGFPRVVVLLMIVLLSISLFKVIKNRKEENNSKVKIAELDPSFLMLIGLILAFVLLINPLGFLLSTLILVSGILVILGQKSPKMIVSISVSTMLVFTFVFGNLLSVPLPRGIGILKSISYLIF